MSQQGSVDKYNRIVHEQFDQHRAPNFLRAMIIKLYRQMTEIRIHAEKK